MYVKNMHTTLIFLMYVLLYGCSNQPGDMDSIQETPTPSSSLSFLSEDKYPDVAYGIKSALQRQLHLSIEEVNIQSVASYSWEDSCLGLQKEMECKPLSSPGYIIRLKAAGEEFIYHATEDYTILLAAAPHKFTGQVIIEWTNSPWEVCMGSKIGFEQIAFGECGIPMITIPFFEETSNQNLRYLWETYAPFTAETPAGKIIFNGQGQTETTHAEQRMIAEWAKLTTMTAQAGRSGAAWGYVISWRENNCNYLNVFITGIAMVNTCQGETSTPAPLNSLSSDQLQTLYDWFDEYSSFDMDQNSLRFETDFFLFFNGNGNKEISREDKQAILDFSNDLFDHLTKQ